MSLESLRAILDEHEYESICSTIESITDIDYFYPSNKKTIINFIIDLANIAYKKGRQDEQYKNSGPIYTLYKKQE